MFNTNKNMGKEELLEENKKLKEELKKAKDILEIQEEIIEDYAKRKRKYEKIIVHRAKKVHLYLQKEKLPDIEYPEAEDEEEL